MIELLRDNYWSALLRSAVLRRKPFFRNLDSHVLSAHVNRFTAISEEYRFVYLRVPKAANLTVLFTLVQNDPTKTAWRDLSGERMRDRVYRHASSFGSSQQQDMLDHWFWFCFVRNPYSRILSAYLDKIVRSRPQKKWVSRWLKRPVCEPIAFLEFLDYLSAEGLGRNLHWAPQAAISPVPVSRYNFIGRVEHLEDDLRFIVEKLFGSSHGITNRTRHATGSSGKLKQFYGEEEMARVRELYRADFEAFRYPDDVLP